MKGNGTEDESPTGSEWADVGVEARGVRSSRGTLGRTQSGASPIMGM
jgi:hypothetical protein